MTAPGGTRGAAGLLRSSPDGPAHADSTVRFESRGVVLVCGPAELAVAAGEQLAKSLRVLVCATGPLPRTSLRGNPAIMGGRIDQVDGHLGRFTAKALGRNGVVDMGPFSMNPDGFFDLILDLNVRPLLPPEARPAGYHAPDPTPAAIEGAIGALSSLIGTFHRPRHIEYDPTHCVHGAQGVAGCTRCLAACPAGAIHSSGDAVAVDEYRCRGCAGCVAACPTGALGYAPLPASQVETRLEKLLRERDGLPTVGLIIVEEDEAPDDTPQAMVLALPAMLCAGAEFWLAALARGVPRVVLKPPRDLPAAGRQELEAQLALAQALLAAVGAPTERIVLWTDGTTAAVPPPLVVRPVPAGLAPGKRAALERSLCALRAPGPASDAAVDLPQHAPLGTVEIDQASCTLCLACTHVCRPGALRADDDGTRLSFTESQCVQCRLCERVCPEKSVSLQPRLLLDPAAREAPRVLVGDTRHRCPACGTPFISKALLARSTRLMRDRWMADDSATERLQLCPACRFEPRPLNSPSRTSAA